MALCNTVRSFASRALRRLELAPLVSITIISFLCFHRMAATSGVTPSLDLAFTSALLAISIEVIL